MQRPRDRRIYKAFSWQRLGKHVPFANDTTSTIEKLCFVCGPCRDIISKEQSEKRVQFCTGGCEVRTRSHEDEESGMLETVVREGLVKTQQAGKGLAGAVVICELWRLAVEM
jgi:hypothetical protein